jgi:hypothetical protein
VPTYREEGFLNSPSDCAEAERHVVVLRPPGVPDKAIDPRCDLLQQGLMRARCDPEATRRYGEIRLAVAFEVRETLQRLNTTRKPESGGGAYEIAGSRRLNVPDLSTTFADQLDELTILEWMPP